MNIALLKYVYAVLSQGSEEDKEKNGHSLGRVY